MQNNQITTSAAGATQPAETKHTPGPWLIHGELDNIKVFAESEDVRACDGIRQVAEIKCGDYEVPNYRESEANARLIAAAPELLAALKSLMTDAQAPGIHYIEDSDFAAACAAIAKAEGRAL